MIAGRNRRHPAVLSLAAFAGLTLLASHAGALVISGGPTYSLPGGGSCLVTGSPALTGGATISCTGINLSAHSNVYFGIRNDTNANGNTMTGANPSGSSAFSYSTSGASSITYTSATTVDNALVSPTEAVSSSLVLTRTAGSATVVSTGGTPADNGNGQIQRLFKLTSGTSFTFTASISAASSSYSGVANPGVYDPTHTPASGAADVSRVDVAFYYSDCGDGVTDSPEQCDLGANNGSPSSCCTTACTFRSAGLTCRAAVGVCDLADTCTGSSATCPADGKSTAQCRASAGVCDPAEICNGVSNNCPADVKSTAVCRASAGACDIVERCDGVNDDCPSDAKSTAVCRAAGGVCDVAEVCDGIDTACPADVKSTAVCRAVGGVCDVAEVCDGVGNACPADAFQPSTTQCRATAGVCDLAENCTGAGADCPADAKSTATCRTSVGACDVADSCDGLGDDCPADAKSTATCRASTGACDLAEVCDGAGDNCPADAVAAAGAECRAVAGGCDVAEVCDGVAVTCPADAYAAAGSECRAAVDVCDVTELCEGSGPDCPADTVVAAGTECRASAGVCDVAESCTGSAGACPADRFLPEGTNCDDATFCNGVQTCGNGVCGGGTSPCDAFDSCDEVTDSCFTGSCPPQAVACRSADQSQLLIKNDDDDDKDKLIWKWGKGADSTQADFSDPRATAEFALCFYAGTTSALIEQISIPPSATKWEAVSTKGYKYSDATGSADGITTMQVMGGTLGKSKAMVKGKGDDLPDFDFDLPVEELPLVVQLRNNQNGLCWESSFTNPTKNLADQFAAKVP